MKLTVLGSGTCIPCLSRRNAGYVLTLNKKYYVIDFGCGNLYQLIKAGFDYKKVSVFFFSHLHPDHIHDLTAFILAAGTDPEFKTKKIRLFGPVGLKKYAVNLFKLYPFLRTYLKLEVRELKNSKERFKGFSLETRRVKHSNAIGFRFECNGKVLVYSGDTGYCKSLVELSKEADVLLLECSTTEEKKMPKHLTPSECGRIAFEANVKKLVLTHFYPWIEKVNIRKRVRKHFKGKIVLARDFLKIRV